PNRIELRMMARYLDLDKSYLVDMLRKVGLHEDYRSDVADFMLIMGLKGYWSTMYSKGHMTAEDLKADIATKELSEVTADRLYKSIVKAEKPERVAEFRPLTRALIIKGYKLEQLERDEAIELLMRHQNYDQPEATYIVDLELALEGSPETPLEYRRIVEEGRESLGQDFKVIPDELIKAEKELFALTKQLKEAEVKEDNEAEIDRLKVERATKKSEFDLLMAQYDLS
ncbi:unnamed protein product, partial [marine sediment metagenome]